MISQNQNSFENLGTILLDLLTRRGKTITEELRDALAFFMLHLGQAEHLGGLCAELDATPQNKKYVELLREAELLTDSRNLTTFLSLLRLFFLTRANRKS